MSDEIPSRELRSDMGGVLRRAAAGETLIRGLLDDLRGALPDTTDDIDLP